MTTTRSKTYESNALFEHLKSKYNLSSDYALAKYLAASAPTISRICTGKRGLTPKMILYIYDRTGLPINDIRVMFKKKIAKDRL
jgi:plasmid maintenance system antidote protein VapI